MSTRRPVATVALLAVLCSLVLAVPAVGGSNQASTAIAVGDASGTPGANVTVDVSASASNVSSYEASLTYDADVVEVVAVDGVDFSDPVVNADTAGRLNFTQVNVNGVDDPTLARITFRIVGLPGNETTLAFDEDGTSLFDADAESIFVDSYDGGQIRVERPATGTATSTGTPNATPTATATSASPDAGDDGGDSETDTPGEGGDDDGSSLLDRVTDESFLLGAGFVVLVVVVGGVGYYLGTRNSGGSRTDW